jgi:hypothetical protein
MGRCNTSAKCAGLGGKAGVSRGHWFHLRPPFWHLRPGETPSCDPARRSRRPSFQIGRKSQSTPLLVRWIYRLANRRQDVDDRLIVRRKLSLATIRPARRGCGGLEQSPDPHERWHDLDDYGDDAVTVEHRRQHRHTLSVNAHGAQRWPPRPGFEVTDCDREATHSPLDKPSMRSGRTRFDVRLIACIRTRASTPCSTAKSSSRGTR